LSLGDAPSAYGPRRTLCNRLVRRAAKYVWEGIFHALASADGPPERVLIVSLAARLIAALRAVRMARPICKQFPRSILSSLHQRIRSQGRTLAKMEIRASRAS
jgi:hypothetical protein